VVTVKDVSGERILSTVGTLLESNGRFFNSYSLEEPERGLGAMVRGFARTDGGEAIVVRIRSESTIQTELEIEGTSYPLFDWGSTKGHVMLIIQYLQERHPSVELNSLIKEHRRVGPLRIFP
jgi:hypothetical protein